MLLTFIIILVLWVFLPITSHLTKYPRKFAKFSLAVLMRPSIIVMLGMFILSGLRGTF